MWKVLQIQLIHFHEVLGKKTKKESRKQNYFMLINFWSTISESRPTIYHLQYTCVYNIRTVALTRRDSVNRPYHAIDDNANWAVLYFRIYRDSSLCWVMVPEEQLEKNVDGKLCFMFVVNM